MSTLVLLDTNAYLRLAKRVRPFVGRQFGQKPYVITILKAVEDEVHAGARLKFQYPWFDNDEFASERLAKAIRLSASDRKNMEIAQGVLHGMAQADLTKYTTEGRSPPGMTDCWVLAFGHVKEAIVVTDDLGMHSLANDFGEVVNVDLPMYNHRQTNKGIALVTFSKEEFAEKFASYMDKSNFLGYSIKA